MTESKDLRTKSANSQYQFDKLLGDTDISGLRFLKEKYKDDMIDYTMGHDLNNPEYFSEYKGIQQRFKMINEELYNRNTFTEDNSLYGDEPHFNSNYDIVTKDEYGEIKVLHPSLNVYGKVDITEIDEDDIR